MAGKAGTSAIAADLRRGTSKAAGVPTTRSGKARTASTPGPKPRSRNGDTKPQPLTPEALHAEKEAQQGLNEALGALAREVLPPRTLGELIDRLRVPMPVDLAERDQLLTRSDKVLVIVGGKVFGVEAMFQILTGSPMPPQDALWMLQMAIRDLMDKDRHTEAIQKHLMTR